MNNSSNNEHFEDQLKKIREKENKLRREKELILAQKPWYTRTQNIIGLLSIVIPIMFSIIFKIVETDSKELSIEYTDSQKLLADNQVSQQNITVNFDSLKIDNISSLNITITNTGDLPIKKVDFSDGPLRFKINDKLVNLKNTKSPFLLSIFKKKDTQQNSKLEIIEQKKGCEFSYLPSLLNPGEQIEIGVLLADEPNVQLELIGKIDNGEILLKQKSIKENNNLKINKTAKLIIQTFRNNLAFFILFVSFFVLTLLIANLGFWQHAKGSELTFEPPLFGKILAILFTLFSIFTLLFYLLMF